MKIASSEIFVVANPPPHFGGRYFVFVKLITDDAVVGYGEIYAATFSPEVVEQMATDVIRRWFIGNDPFQIEAMWRNTYGSGYTLRPDVSLNSVLSGIEMACWDICGKALGKPVYELLGGRVHHRLRSYTYLYPDDDHPGVYEDPDSAAEVAAATVERGFTAVKFDPAGPYTVYDPRMPALADLARSEAFVRRIREAVGDQADLLFGTHGQFSAAGAIRLARRLEPYDPMWLEEPIPPECESEMARVACSTSIPIATGERLTTKWEFHRVLQASAASILQPALGRSGGILETKKIAAIAEAYHAHLAPHLYCGPIEALANIALSTCIPNFLILESIQDFSGFYAQLLTDPIRWEDGYVIPSPNPGLGSDLNEEVARAHPWSGSRLHLEMKTTPS